MNRHEEIKNAYKNLGGEATFYDGMITCSTLSGKAVCKLVWNMDKRKNDHYLELALSGIPNNFSGKMLEVPVGTGILSMPVYETMPDAEITCLDYSLDMMERAKRQAEKRGLMNVHFMQGDVGKLPFDVYEMLKMYTCDGAYASFLDDRAGTIEVGKKADLVILGDNPLTCDVKAISDLMAMFIVAIRMAT